MVALCEPKQEKAAGLQNHDFVYAVIFRRLELDGQNSRFEKLPRKMSPDATNMKCHTPRFVAPG